MKINVTLHRAIQYKYKSMSIIVVSLKETLVLRLPIRQNRGGKLEAGVAIHLHYREWLKNAQLKMNGRCETLMKSYNAFWRKGPASASWRMSINEPSGTRLRWKERTGWLTRSVGNIKPPARRGVKWRPGHLVVETSPYTVLIIPWHGHLTARRIHQRRQLTVIDLAIRLFYSPCHFTLSSLHYLYY